MTTTNNAFVQAAQNRKKTTLLKEQPKQAMSQRTSMPQIRVLGAAHPIEFAEDLAEFVFKQKYATKNKKRLSQGELIELAFYQLRKELNGSPIPDWVTKL